MKIPSIPHNEAERLSALQRYKVLDTLPEQEFDDLTKLAAAICKTPIALISLVDENRQWFKSRVGLSATETPRDISFCGHVVAEVSLLEVPDATKDNRFADNPLVLDDPSIRFYAGAPLMTPDQYALGTLCVIDREPKKLTAQQIQQLEALSRIVVSQLELRRTTHENSQFLAAIVRSSGDAIITHTPEGQITSWNPSATQLFGYTEPEAVGQSIAMLLPAHLLEEEADIMRSIQQGELVDHVETAYLSKNGSQLDVSITRMSLT